MREFLVWAEEHRRILSGVAWTAWLALVASTIRQLWQEFSVGRGGNQDSSARSPWTFAGLLVASLFLFRWPILFSGPLPNPDETQLGAAALTYWVDPVPWRSVDLHTSGPLNAYALWPPLLLLGRLNYPTLHFAALLFQIGTILGVYGCFRKFAAEGVARLATLPLASFYSFTWYPEITQYSSEQLSVLLLSGSAWLLACVRAHHGSTRRGLIFLGSAGFLLGLLPWAKPQSIPLGGALGGAAVLALIVGGPRDKIRRVVALISGAVLPSFAFALLLTIYGLWPQFHSAYILSNQGYTVGFEADREKLWRDLGGEFISSVPLLHSFAWGLVGVAAIAALCVGLFRLAPRGPLMLAWILLAVGAWTVIFPARPFPHYLQFLFLPLAWLGGLALVALLRGCDGFPERWAPLSRRALLLGFLACTTLTLARERWADETPVVGAVVAGHDASLQPVSQRLLALARPGDALTVWGWMPALNVEANLPQGSREGHATREIQDTGMIKFYRDRFLRDLRRRPPRFIVDAVCDAAPMYHSRDNAGTWVFPEFQSYLLAHYRPPEHIGDFLLYVRDERPVERGVSESK